MSYSSESLKEPDMAEHYNCDWSKKQNAYTGYTCLYKKKKKIQSLNKHITVNLTIGSLLGGG